MVLYFLFFLSGLSGLVYQVVWIRVFGNVFGNTLYSASLVVAVFMLGLGAGSYVTGAWADRRYAAKPDSLLRAYAAFELGIAALALCVSLLLPHLGQLSALASAYTREPSGWYALSAFSYVARAAIVVVLLTPITLLMGGTLTLLIRHLVRRDTETSGWRIAVLYGVNTAGAALGCFLTDFALVPASGLRGTQLTAVLVNVIAALGALYLARRAAAPLVPRRSREMATAAPGTAPSLFLVGLALGMSGFAAMGMEIVWFRHFTILLGGFRAVFSLLLTVILVGIGAGSLVSSAVYRRSTRPAEGLMLVQFLFVLSTVAGLAMVNGADIDRLFAGAGASSELWLNVRPMLIEVAVPALLMGFSFPLANAIVQHQERSVGRRAGVLYLANTVGAVCGSVAAGFLLLPLAGIQGSVKLLMALGLCAIAPLARSARANALGVALIVPGVLLPQLLPRDYIINRALPAPMEGERLLTRSEGLTEVISVVQRPGYERILFTNGHPMSSTARFSQRYMRALAHIPLLSMEAPESVLVIGFGVGNTAQAAALHPSVRRVEVADLSRDVLEHADYFSDFNAHVLKDPRVEVYINDGRHHLQMRPPGSYDLVTLEPPPIAFAGVAALYSREFYQLARTRLKPNGYISQWLPAYQEPTATTLAMIRAFVDVFPSAVLLSGAQADLILIGTTAPHIEIDPARVAAVLSGAPAVQADMQRFDLGRVREIVGTFLASPRTLHDATRGIAPVTDDRPLQEYTPRTTADRGTAVPDTVVDLGQVAAWCPRCFAGGTPVAAADGLDTYLRLLDLAYQASPEEALRARNLGDREGRVVYGSRYLGAMVPESVEVHDALGITLAQQGRMDEAITEFQRSLQIDPRSAPTCWHIGAALASRGRIPEAIEYLRRSIALDPSDPRVHSDLAVLEALAQQQRRSRSTR